MYVVVLTFIGLNVLAFFILLKRVFLTILVNQKGCLCLRINAFSFHVFFIIFIIQLAYESRSSSWYHERIEARQGGTITTKLCT